MVEAELRQSLSEVKGRIDPSQFGHLLALIAKLEESLQSAGDRAVIRAAPVPSGQLPSETTTPAGNV